MDPAHTLVTQSFDNTYLVNFNNRTVAVGVLNRGQNGIDAVSTVFMLGLSKQYEELTLASTSSSPRQARAEQDIEGSNCIWTNGKPLQKNKRFEWQNFTHI